MGYKSKSKSEILRVRVEPDLLANLRSVARSRGISLSDVVRELLRRELVQLSDPEYEKKLLLSELKKVREVERRLEETIRRMNSGR